MDSLQITLAVAVFVVGAVLGSFLNVCIYRLPQHLGVWTALRSLVHPPSHCPGCKNLIAWHDNIPILGWFLLRGRCRNCRMRIPFRYAGIELLTATLFVLVFLCEVPFNPLSHSSVQHELGPLKLPLSTLIQMSPETIGWTRCLFHLVLISALIVATFIDYDLMIIPDSVTRPATLVGLLGNWLLGTMYIVPVWYQNPAGLTFGQVYAVFTRSVQAPSWMPSALWGAMTDVSAPLWIMQHPHWHGLLVSLAGIVVGALIVWTVRAVGFWALQREAMGDGDIYLLAMIGSFLGWQATIVVFFLAPMCALAAALAMMPFRRAREIPYGPYLSLATLATLIGFPWIWPSFENGLFSLGPLLLVVALVMVPCLGLLLLLSRRILTALGFETAPLDEIFDEWGPGDQLAYLAMENVDQQQGTWRGDGWTGRLASRGQLAENHWLRPPALSGWQQQWQRRD